MQPSFNGRSWSLLQTATVALDVINGVADGTIGVQQQPPTDACPFDLYVWVPAALRQALQTFRSIAQHQQMPWLLETVEKLLKN